jgi:hypothetical protein
VTARPTTSTLAFGSRSDVGGTPRGKLVSMTTSHSPPSFGSGRVNVIGSGPALNSSRNLLSVTGSPRGSGSLIAVPSSSTATDFA